MPGNASNCSLVAELISTRFEAELDWPLDIVLPLELDFPELLLCA